MGTEINLLESWAEYLAGLVFIIAFIVAILAQSAILIALTSICVGFFSAKIIHHKRKTEPIAPFVIAVIAVVIGLVAGSFFMSRILVLFIFAVSFAGSYYLHDKGIIQTFKSKSFLR